MTPLNKHHTLGDSHGVGVNNRAFASVEDVAAGPERVSMVLPYVLASDMVSAALTGDEFDCHVWFSSSLYAVLLQAYTPWYEGMLLCDDPPPMYVRFRYAYSEPCVNAPV